MSWALFAAGMQVVGALQSGAAERAAAEHNAQMSEQEARMIEAQAKEDERRLRIASRKHLGDMRANVGASGVQMEGSVLDVLAESAATAELDAQTIRIQGRERAYAARMGASLSRSEGASASTRALYGAAGAAASGMAKYMDTMPKRT